MRRNFLGPLLIFCFQTFLCGNLMALEKIQSYQVNADSLFLNEIADQFEIVKKYDSGLGLEVYVQEEKKEAFLKLAPNAVLLKADIGDIFRNDKSQKFLELSKYKKFTDVENVLIAMASQYKNLSTLISYGQSRGGRKLYALKVSIPRKEGEVKKEVLVTAATHGDELITVEVLLRLMSELLSGYGVDSRLTSILEKRDLYFIPVVSPDSFEKRERYVFGVDPNRSFPWPSNPNNAPADCILNLINFTNVHQFSGSLDLHASGRLVIYPWGFTDRAPDTKDEIVFSDLVQRMSRENHYKAGQISRTIYTAKGSSADYFYWKNKTIAIAAELAGEKVPAFNAIPKVINEAREMIWTFLEHFN